MTPDVFATIVSQTPAERVAKVQATTLPALGGLFGGLLFALGAALLVDRADRTIRDPEEAALTFSAPVLSIIPADGDEFAVVAEPNSLAAEAYRGLAAMSIATDRLPKAMMVSSADRRRARAGRRQLRGGAVAARAQGRADGDVGRAGLVPRGVHAERRRHGPPARAARARAQRHAARRVGATQLPVTEFAPNLVVVPPADEPMLHLPIDGLPALLQELSDGGVDVTVIAGPPMLEEADATIVAWATRNVLWAIIPGEVTRAEARAAAVPHGAGRSHAVRRGDGRAADHRGLTCASSRRAVKVASAAADRCAPPSPVSSCLLYHRVGGGSALEIDLDPARFDEQIARGRRVGPRASRSATRSSGSRRAARRVRPRESSVVVTFDDGTADFVDVALPDPRAPPGPGDALPRDRVRRRRARVSRRRPAALVVGAARRVRDRARRRRLAHPHAPAARSHRGRPTPPTSSTARST